MPTESRKSQSSQQNFHLFQSTYQQPKMPPPQQPSSSSSKSCQFNGLYFKGPQQCTSEIPQTQNFSQTLKKTLQICAEHSNNNKDESSTNTKRRKPQPQVLNFKKSNLKSKSKFSSKKVKQQSSSSQMTSLEGRYASAKQKPLQQSLSHQEIKIKKQYRCRCHCQCQLSSNVLTTAQEGEYVTFKNSQIKKNIDLSYQQKQMQQMQTQAILMKQKMEKAKVNKSPSSNNKSSKSIKSNKYSKKKISSNQFRFNQSKQKVQLSQKQNLAKTDCHIQHGDDQDPLKNRPREGNEVITIGPSSKSKDKNTDKSKVKNSKHSVTNPVTAINSANTATGISVKNQSVKVGSTHPHSSSHPERTPLTTTIMMTTTSGSKIQYSSTAGGRGFGDVLDLETDKQIRSSRSVKRKIDLQPSQNHNPKFHNKKKSSSLSSNKKLVKSHNNLLSVRKIQSKHNHQNDRDDQQHDYYNFNKSSKSIYSQRQRQLQINHQQHLNRLTTDSCYGSTAVNNNIDQLQSKFDRKQADYDTLIIMNKLEFSKIPTANLNDNQSKRLKKIHQFEEQRLRMELNQLSKKIETVRQYKAFQSNLDISWI